MYSVRKHLQKMEENGRKSTTGGGIVKTSLPVPFSSGLLSVDVVGQRRESKSLNFEK